MPPALARSSISLTRRWAKTLARCAPAGAPRPAHRMSILYPRRDLSREARERRRAGHAAPGEDTDADGGAPHRDQCRRRTRRPCTAAVLIRRSGRSALDAQAGDPRQHHRPGAAATIYPELNPVENVWLIHARPTGLSNRNCKSGTNRTALRCGANRKKSADWNRWP